MTKPSISETPFGIGLDLRKRAVDAATFLVKNQGSILDIDGAEYLKSSVRMTVSTPVADIYTKAAETDKLPMFTMFDLSRASDVPTVLTLDDITIDGKYISRSMPQALQNAWVNLTPILKRQDAYNGSLQITDTLRLAALVARGLLCMSYNDSDAWLTPNLNVSIIDLYSLLFGIHLKSIFNLDLEETMMVRTLFAAYYAQLLDSPEAPKEVPPLLYRCRFLYQDTGTPRTIDDRLAKISEIRNKVAPMMDLSLDAIAQILTQVGPGRMKKLTSRMLYVFMGRSPTDSQTMTFAADYPPYFVYMLLNSIRGGKNPMINNLLKIGDAKKKLLMFSNELVTSKLFIEKVQR